MLVEGGEERAQPYTPKGRACDQVQAFPFARPTSGAPVTEPLAARGAGTGHEAARDAPGDG